MRQYLEEGGKLFIIQGEKGDANNNTNLNDFLKDYGISFRGDSLIRTSYFKYFHPKQCFIDIITVHPVFLRTIKSIKKMQKIELMDDDNDLDDTDYEYPLKIVYPFC